MPFEYLKRAPGTDALSTVCWSGAIGLGRGAPNESARGGVILLHLALPPVPVVPPAPEFLIADLRPEVEQFLTELRGLCGATTTRRRHEAVHEERGSAAATQAGRL